MKNAEKRRAEFRKLEKWILGHPTQSWLAALMMSLAFFGFFMVVLRTESPCEQGTVFLDGAPVYNSCGDAARAEHSLGELVGARNLYIIDIFDIGGTNPVGRIFYTEGKSLVFFAYDLPAEHSAKYNVWGTKDYNFETVRNLGTLEADNLLQKRWELQVDNTKLLADVDRVFVTAEPVGELRTHPHGENILSAYLRGR